MEKANNSDSILQDIVQLRYIENQMNDVLGKSNKNFKGEDVKNYYNSVKEYSFVYDIHKHKYLGHFEKVSKTEQEYTELCDMFKYLSAKIDRVFTVNFDKIWSNTLPKFMDHIYIK